MRKLLLFPLVLAFFASCVTDDLQPETTPPQTDPYAVPLEDALSEMYSLMGDIYGPATRSSRPKIVFVETVTSSHYGEQTRSTPILAEKLAYVVNFEDEGGFAVLGADIRMPSVICITESGSLTVDNIFNDTPNDGLVTDGGYPTEDEDAPDVKSDPDDSGGPQVEVVPELFIGGLIRDALPGLVIDDVDNSNPDETINGHPVRKPGTENDGNPGVPVYGPWTQDKKIGPLLTTKWHQLESFNKEKSNRPTGCVTVAVAQIVAYNEKPATSYFNVTSSWQDLRAADYSNEQNWDAHESSDIAKIMRSMALGMNAHYNYVGSGGTFIWPIRAEEYMRDKLGYSNANRHKGYDSSVINKMLKNYKPVFIAARERKTLSGHAWVIDGYLKQARTMTIRYSKSGRVEELSGGWREFVHCNFGWGGSSDGYYVHEIFNTNTGPSFNEAGVDATRSTGTDEYVKNFRIIEY